MSGILGNAVTGAGGGAYTIDNSLRFRNSASAYLSKTPGASGSRTTWTMSFWIKLGNTAVNATAGGLFSTNSSTTSFDQFCFSGSVFEWIVVNGSTGRLNSTQVFRDPGSWYHIVATYDSTNATSSDRMRIYVNGSRITAFTTATYPSQNQQSTWNSNVISGIGVNNNGGPLTQYFDGYMAEINFVDGQALTASSFGATDASTGVWQPKAYTGTYGTNGFYLNFSSIATTSGSNAGLGKDFSGNTNYWNTNNISVTSGATYDAMLDSPTPKSATVGNYCVMSPIDKSSSVTISNANLQFASGTANTMGRATMGVSSGKWYWEVFASSVSASTIGVVDASETNVSTYVGSVSTSYSYYSGATKYNNGSSSAYGATWTTNDIIGVALDMDAGTITFYKNGVSQGQAYSGLSGTKIPAISSNTGSSTQTLIANFGQRPFSYSVPSGYNRLQTYNLPTPTVSKGNKYMDITTYTGNGSAGRVITMSNMNNVGFAWVKIRSSADDHRLANTVTGGNRHLKSNNTDAESTGTNMIQAFSSNTFTIGSDTGVNANGSTYVGWCWANDGTSGSTNTAGSITSTVSANTASGFSVVTYTGTGATATVGHGLGVAPSMIIIKNRSVAGNWPTYHASLGNTVGVYLNLTNGAGTTDGFWNNTSPTSTVFTVKDLAASNGSGNSIVAYCFAEKTGFSKFGSYTGNGSTDGPFIYCGFKPAYVMIKRSDTGGTNWWVYDSARGTYNAVVPYLEPNTSTGDGTGYPLGDFLSNGFKVRNTVSNINTSGGTYIYAAFAESPFNYSLAR